jgi:Leucine-rich repeat (LRR) protein
MRKIALAIMQKKNVGNRLSGNYDSCTPTINIWGGAPRAWWNFSEGRATTEQCSDGKIKWGSEGEYAGFDKSTNHNSARLIHVRGIETHTLSDWAKSLRNWAESNDEFDFPVTQKNISELENLRLTFARTLPPEISRLSQLKHLICYSHTGIEDALFSITSLETLELTKPSTKSHLEEIPSSVGNLVNLVSLKASLLGLKNVHEAIGSLEALQSLDLSLNKLVHIPDSVGNLAELQLLELWGNCITVVPNSIGRLRKLEKLSIEGSFDQLPESLGDLAGLREIVIISTQLADVPQHLCSLVELQRLKCNAPIKILSSRLSMLQKLKTLEIQEALLESLPIDVFTMSWLQTLRVVKTPLKLIPDEISGMTNLEYLDLRGTQITSLPRSMLLLKNLRYLNVSLTQIDSLPEWLSDMKSLSKIAGNGIKFPDVLREKKAYDPG